MARFFLEFLGRAGPTLNVQSDLPAEVTVNHTGNLLLVSWGDPSVRIDPMAVRAALSSDRSPDIAGRSTLLIDKRTGATTVAVDRFGLYPAVVLSTPSGLAVASDLATLIGHRSTAVEGIDTAGLAAHLTFGQNLGDRTIWHGVRHLPGGSVFSRPANTAGTVLERRALRLSDWPVDPRGALDRLIDAVDRRLTAFDGTMIPLSGGLDSRLLLACAMAAGHRPETFSYGAKGSADLKIAAALATAAGSAFTAGVIAPESVARQAASVAQTGGGEVPIHHGHGILGAHALAHTLGRPILTGTGSETFRAFYYDRGLPGMSVLGTGLFTAPLQPRVVRWVSEHMACDRLSILAAHAPELADQIGTDLLERIGATLDAAPDLARGLDAVYLDLRVGRFVASGQQLLNRLHPRMHPFLDERVVAGLSGMPTSWKIGARFHRWAIQKLAPGLADIDWDRTERPMSMGLTAAERWPGLVARFGMDGIYAKAGTPIADYRSWARGIDRSALIRRTLKRTTTGPAAVDALETWMSGLDPLHIAGFLTSIDLASGQSRPSMTAAA